MSVDRDEVNRIAGLAKLSLDDGEADRLAEE
ncbi:MAG: Asp-tRNA(Asn)/Glu-tRNA(Gln) amidotransferase GatCAB subunit C, partial [Gemmatimonadetes bacterium]|nr:Asp-tRNA(Asn)/Glu-tRNA(Gln) amidotransferase GatCAB subunit C [Gemmatimonadota bacterium]